MKEYLNYLNKLNINGPSSRIIGDIRGLKVHVENKVTEAIQKEIEKNIINRECIFICFDLDDTLLVKSPGTVHYFLLKWINDKSHK